MSKSHAVTSTILFHMFQQEMPNHEFAHQVFLLVHQSDLLWQQIGDNDPANSMFFVLSNYEISFILHRFEISPTLRVT